MQNLTTLSPISRVIAVNTQSPDGTPYTDKNGREFRILKLQGLNTTMRVIGGIQYPVKTLGRVVSLPQWKENYLNNSQDPFFDAEVGEHIDVSIVSANGLEPYSITNNETGEVREVTSFTFPLIVGQNAETVLKNRGLRFADPNSVETEEYATGSMEDVLNEQELELQD